MVNHGAPTNWTVTLNGTVTPGWPSLLIQVVSLTGPDQTSPLDPATITSANGAGVSYAVTSGNPAFTNEMMWGLFLTSNPVSPFTSRSGWTNESGQEAVSLLEYKNIIAGGAQIATAVGSSNANWNAFAVGFKTATQ